MKGELYLRVQLGLPHSDAARILERHLGEKRAWAYTHEMWDWFAREHPAGQIVGPEAAYLVARGSGWEGDPDKFCSAQVLAGFLAVIPEGFRVRGWEKWAGFYFTVKAKERNKKAGQRRGSPGDVPGTPQGQAPEKPASEGVCPRDPSLVSVSESLVSKGGVGGGVRRVGIGGGLPADTAPGQPEDYPLTAAALAVLWERGVDALWPAKPDSARRVERAIGAATLPVAIERLAISLAAPDAKPWLSFHLDAISGKAGKGPQPVSQDFTKTLEDVARELEAKHGRPA